MPESTRFASDEAARGKCSGVLKRAFRLCSGEKHKLLIAEIRDEIVALEETPLKVGSGGNEKKIHLISLEESEKSRVPIGV